LPFLEGYLLGLGLILLIGPVLFVLLQSTLEGGRTQGLAVALGIFISDIIAILLCGLGFEAWLRSPAVEPWLALSGAGLLLGFGLHSLFKPKLQRPKGPKALDLLTAFGRGFLINFVNPFVFMIWLGIVALGSARHGENRSLVAFMSGSVLAVLSLDCLKVLFAHRLNPLLNPKHLRWLLRSSGFILLAFGTRLLLYGIQTLSQL